MTTPTPENAARDDEPDTVKPDESSIRFKNNINDRGEADGLIAANVDISAKSGNIEN